MFSLLLLSLAVLASIAGVSAYNANDFKSKLFSFNSISSGTTIRFIDLYRYSYRSLLDLGIYEIDIGDITGQFMMAYADFNGDK